LTGYALLDHDDESGITAVGFLCARYAYLATWDLRDLLGELARHPVSLAVTGADSATRLSSTRPRRDRCQRHAAAVAGSSLAEGGRVPERPVDQAVPVRVFPSGELGSFRLGTRPGARRPVLPGPPPKGRY
jgi:hypothetical protein